MSLIRISNEKDMSNYTDYGYKKVSDEIEEIINKWYKVRTETELFAGKEYFGNVAFKVNPDKKTSISYSYIKRQILKRAEEERSSYFKLGDEKVFIPFGYWKNI